MRSRILIAGLLGGVALFMWGFVSHMVLQLGDAGLHSVPLPPNDQALLDSLHGTLPASGLYFYPGMDESKAGDQAEMDAWTARTQTNPHGMIVYQTAPYGGMGGQLVREGLTDVAFAMLAALLLSCALGCCSSLACRVGFVASLGVVTALRPIQQWNWYDFPEKYTLAQVADGVLGFLIMGIVIALIVKPRPAET